MAVRSVCLETRFSWLRTIALSSTFLIHLTAIVVVAIPIVAPLANRLPQVLTAVVLETEKPSEVLPVPPLPVPPPRVKPLQRPAAAATPVAPPPAPSPQAVVPDATPMSTPAVAETSASLPSTSNMNPPMGESRTLAYDGALKLRYPPTSMSRREQGTVLLRVLVDAEGNVKRIEIARSSGHSQLDSAALEAVQRGHFRPVMRDGLAVPAWGVVPIEFRLDRT